MEAFANDYVYNTLQLTDTTLSRQKNDAEAIFGSLEYAFTSALKVRAGLRFTEDHKTFSVPYTDVAGGLPPPESASARASRLNWDFSPTYQLAPDVNLYARIATGFRAPSFGAPSAGPPALSVQVARSEDNISYETGVKAEMFDRRATVSFDIYYFDVSHQQLTAVGGAANVTQLLNADHTIGKGAELDFEAHPLQNLLVNVSASYNFTRIEDQGLAVAPCFNWGAGAACTPLNPLNSAGLAEINGNPLPQAARFTGDFSLRYGHQVGPGELYFYTDMSYRSAINFFLDEEKEFIGAPLFQGGLRMGYIWGQGKYEVAAFCRNCTDEIRVIGGINFDNATGMINDPRIIGGQASVKF